MNSNAPKQKHHYHQRSDNQSPKLNELATTLTNLAEGLTNMSLQTNMTFETRINDHKGPNVTIKKLSFLNPQNILQWTMQVRNLFQLSKTDQETSMAIIRTLLEENLLHLIDDIEEPDLALDKLIKETFPREHFITYERILNKIKTKDFNSITKFYLEFNKYITMANSCLDKNEKLTARETLSYFEGALSRQQKIRLLNIDTSDIKIMVQYLFKY
ncbi:hypothetical protein H311_04813, partial [Anncaliia algerae PRA109]